MKILGKVVAVLNTNLLLIQIKEGPTRAGTELTIFSEIAIGRLNDELDIDSIHVPKGRVRVVSEETDGLVVAERFKEGERVERRPITAALGNIFDLSQEVVVGGTWSAKVNQNDNLKITYSTEVGVGDPVGLA